MSKSVLIIDTPANCFECPCFMEMGWRCQCRLDIDEDVHDGRPPWCPLKEGKKIIPIEWINSYTTALIFSDDYVDNAEGIDDYIYCIDEMVRDWEKENEQNK